MAIQNRRGADSEFDANKALPGEFGFTTDGTRKVYACFAPGDAREVAFKDQIPVVANFTQGELQEAVDNFLTENPVQAGATEEQVQQIEKNKQNITLLSNPNLLINGDFQIWQRGTSFGVDTTIPLGTIYTADMWRLNNKSLSNVVVKKDAKGLSLSNVTGAVSICQPFEDTFFEAYAGKDYTLTKCIDDVITVEYGTIPAENTVFVEVEVTQDAIINYVKLEIGTVSTPCIPKLYAEELALCQRYFFKISEGYYPCMSDVYGSIYIYLPQLKNMRDIKKVTMISDDYFGIHQITPEASNSISNIQNVFANTCNLSIYVPSDTFAYNTIAILQISGATFEVDASIYDGDEEQDKGVG